MKRERTRPGVAGKPALAIAKEQGLASLLPGSFPSRLRSAEGALFSSGESVPGSSLGSFRRGQALSSPLRLRPAPGAATRCCDRSRGDPGCLVPHTCILAQLHATTAEITRKSVAPAPYLGRSLREPRLYSS